jgi:3-hydroxybutyryl-CoA dehydrogenase
LTNSFKQCGIIGVGAMGTGIAQMAAQAGCSVWLLDARSGAAQSAAEQLRQTWARLVEKGKLTAEQADWHFARLRVAAQMGDLKDCDLVVEAIVERLEAKHALLREVESVVGDACVVASNTSSLSIAAMGGVLRRPQRLAGFHFFNPVPMMRVVEVVRGVHTDEAVLEALEAFARAFGHTPVRAQDTPGFIVNHAGRGFGTEALRMVGESVADFATVDAVLKDQAGFRLGPFELMDLTGLDVSHPVMESVYRQYFDEPRYRPSVITAQRLAAGLLGRKSGAGFYSYAEGSRVPSASANAPTSNETPPVWLAPAAQRRDEAVAVLAACGAHLEAGEHPSDEALVLVAPLGDDVSATVAATGLVGAATRTLAWDLFLPDAAVKRRVLATTPATLPRWRDAAAALLARDGKAVSVIGDSSGFITPRVLATIVNIACDMCQQGVCSPSDLDTAVTLGLGYPQGPLAWGDSVGSARIVATLEGIHRCTQDPRYRVSPWLRRRAQLGMSLLESGA